MFTPIREIITVALRQPGFAKQAQANRVVSSFRLLVKNRFGEDFLDRVGHISYQQSILLVNAQSPLIVQELRLYATDWLKGLEKECGKDIVKAVRFFVGA